MSPIGAYNLEVGPIFLGNLWAPGLLHCDAFECWRLALVSQETWLPSSL